MIGEPRLPDTVQTIAETLAFWAERTPQAPALVTPGRPPITYAALWHCASGLADSLRRGGIHRNDRVMLVLPEGPHLAAALLGVMSATTAAAVSAALTAREIAAILPGLDAAAAIVPPRLPAAIAQTLSQHHVPIFELRMDGDAHDIALAGRAPVAAARGEPAEPQDTATFNQTSGTTGRPKWSPRSQSGVIQGGREHRDRFGLTCRDRSLLVAPLTQSLGRTAMTHNLVTGGALITPAASDLEFVWHAIEDERPTWMHTAAGFLELLAAFLTEHPELPPPVSLRFVRVTAAAISPQVCDELATRLAASILPSYSMSETGIIASALPPPAQNKPGSTGRPIQEVRIVDTAARDIDQGLHGEIWVRGPRIITAYVDDPVANETTFMPNGWFRTGDVGYLDDDGFLFITGRVKELINRGGTKIAPGEIDAVLLAHPAVHAAAAFATPDARLGEHVVAAVVLEPGHAAAPRVLRRWMLDRLAPHKVPRRIWFVEDLPRTASGKVRRDELAQQWQSSQ
jgi:acyl-CoA synthetase (AMP-forming)/AMP-acid ligase II